MRYVFVSEETVETGASLAGPSDSGTGSSSSSEIASGDGLLLVFMVGDRG